MKIALIGRFAYREDVALESFFSKALSELGHEVMQAKVFDGAEVRGITVDADVSLNVKMPLDPGILSGKTVLYYPDFTTRFPELWHGSRWQDYDYVFLPHKEEIIDNKKVFWLPVGYDPDAHKPWITELEQDIDLLFVGTYRPERDWIRDLEKEFKDLNVVICGNDWPDGRNPAYGDSKIRLHARAKLVLNQHYPGETGPNMRFFEALAMRSCLLSDDVPGPPELGFADTVNHLVYQDTFHLKKRIRWCLNRGPDYLLELRNRGRRDVRKHTYKNRMQEMLETVMEGEA